MQGTEDPERRKGIPAEMRVFRSVPHKKRRKQTSARNTTARSASPQPGKRQPQAGTVEHDKGFFSEATQGRTFQVARFLGRRLFNPLFLPRSIADNGSSWRRGAAPALHRRDTSNAGNREGDIGNLEVGLKLIQHCCSEMLGRSPCKH